MRHTKAERQAFALRAEAAIIREHYARAEYGAAMQVARARFGDGDGILISGIGRSHFPASVKVILRRLAQAPGALADASLSDWRAAGRRLHTWRRLRDSWRGRIGECGSLAYAWLAEMEAACREAEGTTGAAGGG